MPNQHKERLHVGLQVERKIPAHLLTLFLVLCFFSSAAGTPIRPSPPAKLMTAVSTDRGNDLLHSYDCCTPPYIYNILHTLKLLGKVISSGAVSRAYKYKKFISNLPQGTLLQNAPVLPLKESLKFSHLSSLIPRLFHSPESLIPGLEARSYHVDVPPASMVNQTRVRVE